MADSIQIPCNGTIADYQHYIRAVLTKRGFINQSVDTRFTLLVEEVGELAKSLRKMNNEKVDINSRITNVHEELADVLFVLISIANKLDIDLSEAFVNKEELNNLKVWI